MTDERLTEAKLIPMMEIADRLGVAGLKRTGREWVGPCPVCGGRDRFGINPDKGVWNCRQCGAGDGIKLVSHVLGCDFKGALSWLMGEAGVDLDPAEAARRKLEVAKKERARRDLAERKRAEAIADAQSIWSSCAPAAGTPVSEYLRLRALPVWIADSPPDCLRFHPSLPYMAPSGDSRNYVEIHRGPAMVASCVDAQGLLTAVHRTWLDLSQPKGKLKILHDGLDMPAKKIWGHKKGSSIRLSQPRGFKTLIVGEGIETTLTARAANAYSDAAYWCGIDLGNMAGQRLIRGDGMKYAGIPDLDDEEAFVPPEGVEWLIFIQDGDSEPRLTRAKLLSGLRRAKTKVSSVNRISIIHPGHGIDLNDLLMGESPLPTIKPSTSATPKTKTAPRTPRDPFLESTAWQLLRYATLKRLGYRCMCCGWEPTRKNRKAKNNYICVDHIKPRSKYPELALVPDNLQVLCAECNHGKFNIHHDDFRELKNAEH